MKEHEQRTSRLEKISIFFGLRNFSRLNFYGKSMKRKLLSILLALSAVILWGAKKNPDWIIIPDRISEHTEAEIKSFSQEEFNLT